MWFTLCTVHKHNHTLAAPAVQGFRKWTAFIAHHPYTVAGVSLFLMIALSAIAFLVIPFDQGGGNGAGNFLAIGEKWVEEVRVCVCVCVCVFVCLCVCLSRFGSAAMLDDPMSFCRETL